MTECEEYAKGIQPELLNVTHLFNISDEEWQGNITFMVCQRESNVKCTFHWCNNEITEATTLFYDSDERLNTLHRKRAVRRLIKQTCYDICAKVTGIHPPWGSSTGVRPTHLFYEKLSEGFTPDEAALSIMDEFDISKEKTSLLKEIVEAQLQMVPPDDNSVDVYIGIPFCTTRCTYCSFSSGEIGDGRLTEPYISALFKEMEYCSKLIKETGKKLRAVYVGGGTPTALNNKQFGDFVEKLQQLFNGCIELTIEAGRPDTITEEKLKTISDAGVNRISINPQTMNDRTLDIIGRKHTAQQVVEAYALGRKYNIGHINMDVIAGLPGEGISDFERTMEYARLLKPESLTVHTLTIKRGSKMSLINAPLPEGTIVSDMVNTGRITAKEMGMKPYYMYRQKNMAGNLENVGYALPGHFGQYNVDMMEETTNIIAIGAGAISKRVYAEEGHIERAPNVSNIEEYILRVDEMMQRKKQLFEN